MRRIYEDTAYGPLPDAGNFWRTTIAAPGHPPLRGDVSTGFAIIGGGFTGLNAALTLAQAGADVALFDAEQPGWGASGRNGGFCCLGGAAMDGDQLITRYGASDAARFFETERRAVDLVRDRLGALGIDADTHSQGETRLAHRPRAAREMADEAAKLSARYGVACDVIGKSDLAAIGMQSPAFHGGLTVPIGFALNPLKYALGLAGASQAAGARIFGASPVTKLTRAAGGFRLTTPQGTLTARKILIATNGYSSEDLPGALAGRYLPAQSSILVTRPLTEDEIAAQGWSSDQMCYDSRNLLHYFRLMPDRRFLFGMRGAVRCTPARLAQVRQLMRTDFEAMFPAWMAVDTPHFWSGLVSLSRSLTPFVGEVPGIENAFAAMNYHGNGVAMGSYAGRAMARLALGEDPEVPDLMRTPMQRFELGRWRRALLPLAYRWYEWRDRA